MSSENGKAQRGPNPKSDRQRVLAAAVKAIREAGEPLSREEIDSRVRVRTKGKTTPAGWVGDACSKNVEVDGVRFVRVGRGTYDLEAVGAE